MVANHTFLHENTSPTIMPPSSSLSAGYDCVWLGVGYVWHCPCQSVARSLTQLTRSFFDSLLHACLAQALYAPSAPLPQVLQMPQKKHSSRVLAASPSCPEDLNPLQLQLTSLLNESYRHNKKEGLSFRQMCHAYQSEHSQPGAIQAKVTTVLTAVGEPEPSSYLPGCDPDLTDCTKTSVLEWSYTADSMWRGPNTPWDHNVLKLAKAMVATGFRQD